MEATPQKKPKVLVDARMVSAFEHGISRYVTDIATGLFERQESIRFEPVFVLSKREKRGLEKKAPWNQVSVRWAESPFLHPREWIEIPRLLKAERARAFHSPSFASFPWLPVPYLVTVHDLIHLSFGSLSRRAYYSGLLKRFARKADVLATVSNSARTEIAKWLRVDPEKIAVHPNALAPLSVEEDLSILTRGGLEPGAYFLAVANDKSHKNLAMARRAHSAASVDIPFIVAHEFLDRVDPRRESANAFATLFRNARAIVSPSLEEGFGRVPVEAVLEGLPVLLSNIPPHVEIFEGLSTDGIRFCDPKDFECWIRAFQQTANQDVSRPSNETTEALKARFAPEHLLSPVIRAYEELIRMGAASC